MVEIKYTVRLFLMLSTIAIAIANEEHDRCGSGPHFYNLTGTGFSTIYQLFGRHVHITANVTETVAWTVGSGASSLEPTDIQALNRSGKFKVQSQDIDIAFVNRTLDGIQVFAQIVIRESNITQRGGLVSIRSGYAPNVTVNTQVCSNNISVCGNVTGMPHPSIVAGSIYLKRFKTIERQSWFCITINRLATSNVNDASMTINISNCFGEVIITATIPKDTQGTTHPCVARTCSIRNRENNSASCPIASISISIRSVTRLQSRSDLFTRITKMPVQSSRPTIVPSSPLFNNKTAFTSSLSTSTPRRNGLTVSSIRTRNNSKDSKAVTQSVRLSTTPVLQDNINPSIQSSEDGGSSYIGAVAAIGAVVLLTIVCLLLFICCRRERRRAAAAATDFIDEHTYENRRSNLAEAKFTAETSQDTVYVNEMKWFNKSRSTTPTGLNRSIESHIMSNGNEISQPDDHQYAQLLSSSAHHDDGYQSLLPIRGDELRQTSAVILPLDAEADQLMGSAAQNDTDNTQSSEIQNSEIRASEEIDKSSIKLDDNELKQKDEVQYADLDLPVSSELNERLATKEKVVYAEMNAEQPQSRMTDQ